MHIKRLVLSIAVFLTMLMSLPIQAAFQYTYTSLPFEYLENSYEFSPGREITTDSFLKIVINSDSLLSPVTTPSTDELLAAATFDFTIGGYSNRAEADFNSGIVATDSELYLNAIDSNGLPTDWSFAFSKNVLTGPGGTFQAVSYSSISGTTQFFSTDANLRTFEEIFAAAIGGQWTLKEISSPVPELPESAMLIAGLGLIAFAQRRKSKKL